MNRNEPGTQRFDDESRFELGMMATARARRNRPMAPVMLAGVLLVVSGVVALSGLAARAAAVERRRAELATDAAVDRNLTEYQRLAALVPTTGDSADRSNRTFSTIESLAARAGINRSLAPPKVERPAIGNSRYARHITYSGVTAPELGPLVEWLRLVTTELRGFRVYELNLVPGETQWTMEVTFQSLE